MHLSEFKVLLAQNPERNLRFQLPDGTMIPAHAHVSEVARVEKHFIDCGGVLRADAFCRLQTWVYEDTHHRLSAGKLLGILATAESILNREDLEVDVEHEVGFVTQMPLESMSVQGEELLLKLGHRHTDCLAKDRCQTAPPVPQTISFRGFSKKP